MLILICSILICLVAAWQDAQHRYIHIAVPIGIAIASLAFGLLHTAPHQLLLHCSLSLTFLGTQFLALKAYHRIKTGHWAVITDRSIGLGDMLFVLAILPFFTFPQFVLFCLAFQIIAILGALTLHRNKTIPLVSYASGCLMVFLLITELDFFTTLQLA